MQTCITFALSHLKHCIGISKCDHVSNAAEQIPHLVPLQYHTVQRKYEVGGKVKSTGGWNRTTSYTATLCLTLPTSHFLLTHLAGNVRSKRLFPSNHAPLNPHSLNPNPWHQTQIIQPILSSIYKNLIRNVILTVWLWFESSIPLPLPHQFRSSALLYLPISRKNRTTPYHSATRLCYFPLSLPQLHNNKVMRIMAYECVCAHHTLTTAMDIFNRCKIIFW
jgi:hypothetical protein